MKKFRNFLLMSGIVLAGAVAAFASNATKSASDSEDGYLFDSTLGRCIKRGVCSSTPGNTCMWVDEFNEPHNLSSKSGTTCTIHLAKLQ